MQLCISWRPFAIDEYRYRFFVEIVRKNRTEGVFLIIIVFCFVANNNVAHCKLNINTVVIYMYSGIILIELIE
jgi:hypothetical protein